MWPLPAVVTGKRQNAPPPLHNCFLSLTAVKIKLCCLLPHVASSFADEGAGLQIFGEWPGQRCTHPIYREVEEQLCVFFWDRSKLQGWAHLHQAREEAYPGTAGFVALKVPDIPSRNKGQKDSNHWGQQGKKVRSLGPEKSVLWSWKGWGGEEATGRPLRKGTGLEACMRAAHWAPWATRCGRTSR